MAHGTQFRYSVIVIISIFLFCLTLAILPTLPLVNAQLDDEDLPEIIKKQLQTERLLGPGFIVQQPDPIPQIFWEDTPKIYMQIRNSVQPTSLIPLHEYDIDVHILNLTATAEQYTFAFATEGPFTVDGLKCTQEYDEHSPYPDTTIHTTNDIFIHPTTLPKDTFDQTKFVPASTTSGLYSTNHDRWDIVLRGQTQHCVELGKEGEDKWVDEAGDPIMINSGGYNIYKTDLYNSSIPTSAALHSPTSAVYYRCVHHVQLPFPYLTHSQFLGRGMPVICRGKFVLFQIRGTVRDYALTIAKYLPYRKIATTISTRPSEASVDYTVGVTSGQPAPIRFTQRGYGIGLALETLYTRIDDAGLPLPHVDIVPLIKYDSYKQEYVNTTTLFLRGLMINEFFTTRPYIWIKKAREAAIEAAYTRYNDAKTYAKNNPVIITGGPIAGGPIAGGGMAGGGAILLSDQQQHNNTSISGNNNINTNEMNQKDVQQHSILQFAPMPMPMPLPIDPPTPEPTVINSNLNFEIPLPLHGIRVPLPRIHDIFKSFIKLRSTRQFHPTSTNNDISDAAYISPHTRSNTIIFDVTITNPNAQISQLLTTESQKNEFFFRITYDQKEFMNYLFDHADGDLNTLTQRIRIFSPQPSSSCPLYMIYHHGWSFGIRFDGSLLFDSITCSFGLIIEDTITHSPVSDGNNNNNNNISSTANIEEQGKTAKKSMLDAITTFHLALFNPFEFNAQYKVPFNTPPILTNITSTNPYEEDVETPMSSYLYLTSTTTKTIDFRFALRHVNDYILQRFNNTYLIPTYTTTWYNTDGLLTLPNVEDNDEQSSQTCKYDNILHYAQLPDRDEYLLYTRCNMMNLTIDYIIPDYFNISINTIQDVLLFIQHNPQYQSITSLIPADVGLFNITTNDIKPKTVHDGIVYIDSDINEDHCNLFHFQKVTTNPDETLMTIDLTKLSTLSQDQLDSIVLHTVQTSIANTTLTYIQFYCTVFSTTYFIQPEQTNFIFNTTNQPVGQLSTRTSLSQAFTDVYNTADWGQRTLGDFSVHHVIKKQSFGPPPVYTPLILNRSDTIFPAVPFVLDDNDTNESFYLGNFPNLVQHHPHELLPSFYLPKVTRPIISALYTSPLYYSPTIHEFNTGMLVIGHYEHAFNDFTIYNPMTRVDGFSNRTRSLHTLVDKERQQMLTGDGILTEKYNNVNALFRNNTDSAEFHPYRGQAQYYKMQIEDVITQQGDKIFVQFHPLSERHHFNVSRWAEYGVLNKDWGRYTDNSNIPAPFYELDVAEDLLFKNRTGVYYHEQNQFIPNSNNTRVNGIVQHHLPHYILNGGTPFVSTYDIDKKCIGGQDSTYASNAACWSGNIEEMMATTRSPFQNVLEELYGTLYTTHESSGYSDPLSIQYTYNSTVLNQYYINHTSYNGYTYCLDLLLVLREFKNYRIREYRSLLNRLQYQQQKIQNNTTDFDLDFNNGNNSTDNSYIGFNTNLTMTLLQHFYENPYLFLLSTATDTTPLTHAIPDRSPFVNNTAMIDALLNEHLISKEIENDNTIGDKNTNSMTLYDLFFKMNIPPNPFDITSNTIDTFGNIINSTKLPVYNSKSIKPIQSAMFTMSAFYRLTWDEVINHMDFTFLPAFAYNSTYTGVIPPPFYRNMQNPEKDKQNEEHQNGLKYQHLLYQNPYKTYKLRHIPTNYPIQFIHNIHSISHNQWSTFPIVADQIAILPKYLLPYQNVIMPAVELSGYLRGPPDYNGNRININNYMLHYYVGQNRILAQWQSGVTIGLFHLFQQEINSLIPPTTQPKVAMNATTLEMLNITPTDTIIDRSPVLRGFGIHMWPAAFMQRNQLVLATFLCRTKVSRGIDMQPHTPTVISLAHKAVAETALSQTCIKEHQHVYVSLNGIIRRNYGYYQEGTTDKAILNDMKINAKYKYCIKDYCHGDAERMPSIMEYNNSSLADIRVLYQNIGRSIWVMFDPNSTSKETGLRHNNTDLIIVPIHNLTLDIINRAYYEGNDQGIRKLNAVRLFNHEPLIDQVTYQMNGYFWDHLIANSLMSLYVSFEPRTYILHHVDTKTNKTNILANTAKVLNNIKNNDKIVVYDSINKTTTSLVNKNNIYTYWSQHEAYIPYSYVSIQSSSPHVVNHGNAFPPSILRSHRMLSKFLLFNSDPSLFALQNERKNKAIILSKKLKLSQEQDPDYHPASGGVAIPVGVIPVDKLVANFDVDYETANDGFMEPFDESIYQLHNLQRKSFQNTWFYSAHRHFFCTSTSRIDFKYDITSYSWMTGLRQFKAPLRQPLVFTFEFSGFNFPIKSKNQNIGDLTTAPNNERLDLFEYSHFGVEFQYPFFYGERLINNFYDARGEPTIAFPYDDPIQWQWDYLDNFNCVSINKNNNQQGAKTTTTWLYPLKHQIDQNQFYRTTRNPTLLFGFADPFVDVVMQNITRNHYGYSYPAAQDQEPILDTIKCQIAIVFDIPEKIAHLYPNIGYDEPILNAFIDDVVIVPQRQGKPQMNSNTPTLTPGRSTTPSRSPVTPTIQPGLLQAEEDEDDGQGNETNPPQPSQPPVETTDNTLLQTELTKQHIDPLIKVITDHMMQNTTSIVKFKVVRESIETHSYQWTVPYLYAEITPSTFLFDHSDDRLADVYQRSQQQRMTQGWCSKPYVGKSPLDKESDEDQLLFFKDLLFNTKTSYLKNNNNNNNNKNNSSSNKNPPFHYDFVNTTRQFIPYDVNYILNHWKQHNNPAFTAFLHYNETLQEYATVFNITFDSFAHRRRDLLKYGRLSKGYPYFYREPTNSNFGTTPVSDFWFMVSRMYGHVPSIYATHTQEQLNTIHWPTLKVGKSDLEWYEENEEDSPFLHPFQNRPIYTENDDNYGDDTNWSENVRTNEGAYLAFGSEYICYMLLTPISPTAVDIPGFNIDHHIKAMYPPKRHGQQYHVALFITMHILHTNSIIYLNSTLIAQKQQQDGMETHDGSLLHPYQDMWLRWDRRMWCQVKIRPPFTPSVDVETLTSPNDGYSLYGLPYRRFHIDFGEDFISNMGTYDDTDRGIEERGIENASGDIPFMFITPQGFSHCYSSTSYCPLFRSIMRMGVGLFGRTPFSDEHGADIAEYSWLLMLKPFPSTIMPTQWGEDATIQGNNNYAYNTATRQTPEYDENGDLINTKPHDKILNYFDRQAASKCTLVCYAVDMMENAVDLRTVNLTVFRTHANGNSNNNSNENDENNNQDQQQQQQLPPSTHPINPDIPQTFTPFQMEQIAVHPLWSQFLNWYDMRMVDNGFITLFRANPFLNRIELLALSGPPPPQSDDDDDVAPIEEEPEDGGLTTLLLRIAPIVLNNFVQPSYYISLYSTPINPYTFKPIAKAIPTNFRLETGQYKFDLPTDQLEPQHILEIQPHSTPVWEGTSRKLERMRQFPTFQPFRWQMLNIPQILYDQRMLIENKRGRKHRRLYKNYYFDEDTRRFHWERLDKDKHLLSNNNPVRSLLVLDRPMLLALRFNRPGYMPTLSTMRLRLGMIADDAFWFQNNNFDQYHYNDTIHGDLPNNITIPSKIPRHGETYRIHPCPWGAMELERKVNQTGKLETWLVAHFHYSTYSIPTFYNQSIETNDLTTPDLNGSPVQGIPRYGQTFGCFAHLIMISRQIPSDTSLIIPEGTTVLIEPIPVALASGPFIARKPQLDQKNQYAVGYDLAPVPLNPALYPVENHPELKDSMNLQQLLKIRSDYVVPTNRSLIRISDNDSDYCLYNGFSVEYTTTVQRPGHPGLNNTPTHMTEAKMNDEQYTIISSTHEWFEYTKSNLTSSLGSPYRDNWAMISKSHGTEPDRFSIHRSTIWITTSFVYDNITLSFVHDDPINTLKRFPRLYNVTHENYLKDLQRNATRDAGGDPDTIDFSNFYVNDTDQYKYLKPHNIHIHDVDMHCYSPVDDPTVDLLNYKTHSTFDQISNDEKNAGKMESRQRYVSGSLFPFYAATQHDDKDGQSIFNPNLTYTPQYLRDRVDKMGSFEYNEYTSNLWNRDKEYDFAQHPTKMYEDITASKVLPNRLARVQLRPRSIYNYLNCSFNIYSIENPIDGHVIVNFGDKDVVVLPFERVVKFNATATTSSLATTVFFDVPPRIFRGGERVIMLIPASINKVVASPGFSKMFHISKRRPVQLDADELIIDPFDGAYSYIHINNDLQSVGDGTLRRKRKQLRWGGGKEGLLLSNQDDKQIEKDNNDKNLNKKQFETMGIVEAEDTRSDIHTNDGDTQQQLQYCGLEQDSCFVPTDYNNNNNIYTTFSTLAFEGNNKNNQNKNQFNPLWIRETTISYISNVTKTQTIVVLFVRTDLIYGSNGFISFTHDVTSTRAKPYIQQLEPTPAQATWSSDKDGAPRFELTKYIDVTAFYSTTKLFTVQTTLYPRRLLDQNGRTRDLVSGGYPLTPNEQLALESTANYTAKLQQELTHKPIPVVSNVTRRFEMQSLSSRSSSRSRAALQPPQIPPLSTLIQQFDILNWPKHQQEQPMQLWNESDFIYAQDRWEVIHDTKFPARNDNSMLNNPRAKQWNLGNPHIDQVNNGAIAIDATIRDLDPENLLLKAQVKVNVTFPAGTKMLIDLSEMRIPQMSADTRPTASCVITSLVQNPVDAWGDLVSMRAESYNSIRNGTIIHSRQHHEKYLYILQSAQQHLTRGEWGTKSWRVARYQALKRDARNTTLSQQAWETNKGYVDDDNDYNAVHTKELTQENLFQLVDMFYHDKPMDTFRYTYSVTGTNIANLEVFLPSLVVPPVRKIEELTTTYSAVTFECKLKRPLYFGLSSKTILLQFFGPVVDTPNRHIPNNLNSTRSTESISYNKVQKPILLATKEVSYISHILVTKQALLAAMPPYPTVGTKYRSDHLDNNTLLILPTETATPSIPYTNNVPLTEGLEDFITFDVYIDTTVQYTEFQIQYIENLLFRKLFRPSIINKWHNIERFNRIIPIQDDQRRNRWTLEPNRPNEAQRDPLTFDEIWNGLYTYDGLWYAKNLMQLQLDNLSKELQLEGDSENWIDTRWNLTQDVNLELPNRDVYNEVLEQGPPINLFISSQPGSEMTPSSSSSLKANKKQINKVTQQANTNKNIHKSQYKIQQDIYNPDQPENGPNPQEPEPQVPPTQDHRKKGEVYSHTWNPQCFEDLMMMNNIHLNSTESRPNRDVNTQDQSATPWNIPMGSHDDCYPEHFDLIPTNVKDSRQYYDKDVYYKKLCPGKVYYFIDDAEHFLPPAGSSTHAGMTPESPYLDPKDSPVLNAFLTFTENKDNTTAVSPRGYYWGTFPKRENTDYIPSSDPYDTSNSGQQGYPGSNTDALLLYPRASTYIPFQYWRYEDHDIITNSIMLWGRHYGYHNIRDTYSKIPYTNNPYHPLFNKTHTPELTLKTQRLNDQANFGEGPNFVEQVVYSDGGFDVLPTQDSLYYDLMKTRVVQKSNGTIVSNYTDIARTVAPTISHHKQFYVHNWTYHFISSRADADTILDNCQDPSICHGGSGNEYYAAFQDNQCAGQMDCILPPQVGEDPRLHEHIHTHLFPNDCNYFVEQYFPNDKPSFPYPSSFTFDKNLSPTTTTSQTINELSMMNQTTDYRIRKYIAKVFEDSTRAQQHNQNDLDLIDINNSNNSNYTIITNLNDTEDIIKKISSSAENLGEQAEKADNERKRVIGGITGVIPPRSPSDPRNLSDHGNILLPATRNKLFFLQSQTIVQLPQQSVNVTLDNSQLYAEKRHVKNQQFTKRHLKLTFAINATYIGAEPADERINDLDWDQYPDDGNNNDDDQNDYGGSASLKLGKKQPKIHDHYVRIKTTGGVRRIKSPKLSIFEHQLLYVPFIFRTSFYTMTQNNILQIGQAALIPLNETNLSTSSANEPIFTSTRGTTASYYKYDWANVQHRQYYHGIKKITSSDIVSFVPFTSVSYTKPIILQDKVLRSTILREAPYRAPNTTVSLFDGAADTSHLAMTYDTLTQFNVTQTNFESKNAEFYHEQVMYEQALMGNVPIDELPPLNLSNSGGIGQYDYLTPPPSHVYTTTPTFFEEPPVFPSIELSLLKEQNDIKYQQLLLQAAKDGQQVIDNSADDGPKSDKLVVNTNYHRSAIPAYCTTPQPTLMVTRNIKPKQKRNDTTFSTTIPNNSDTTTTSADGDDDAIGSIKLEENVDFPLIFDTINRLPCGFPCAARCENFHLCTYDDDCRSAICRIDVGGVKRCFPSLV